MSTTPLQTASTYYQANPGTRWLRWALGLSEKLWPALAVRGAYRVFGTPLPPKWLHRRQPALAAWRATPWPFEQASITLYEPPGAPGPVVLLLHGWGGHAAQMLPLAQALRDQGLRPVLVDLPAHGRSQGSTSNLPQFARAIEYLTARLQQQGHEVRAVAAHSLAANALAYAAARGLPVARLALLAPPASPHAYTRLFAKVFGLSEDTRERLQQRVEAREGILMRQFEPAAARGRGHADRARPGGPHQPVCRRRGLPRCDRRRAPDGDRWPGPHAAAARRAGGERRRGAPAGLSRPATRLTSSLRWVRGCARCWCPPAGAAAS
jgi:pimeloyl-ACP methyl ester carboxylesterase